MGGQGRITLILSPPDPANVAYRPDCAPATCNVSNLTIDILGIERLLIGYIMTKKPDLLQGTLDMLILNTLTRAPLHGYAIAQSIKRRSGDVLTVEEGSLYPALQRLLLRGWVKAQWKTTETNRRARYYTLTATGRRQLGNELSQFEEMIAAIGRTLETP